MSFAKYEIIRFGEPIHMTAIYYRPQTKFAKVMFLHMSLSHSVHKGGGGVWSLPLEGGVPAPGCACSRGGACSRGVPGRDPPQLLLREVRILLECILVLVVQSVVTLQKNQTDLTFVTVSKVSN